MFGVILGLSAGIAVVAAVGALFVSKDGFDESLPAAVAAGTIMFWAALFILMLFLAAL